MGTEKEIIDVTLKVNDLGSGVLRTFTLEVENLSAVIKQVAADMESWGSCIVNSISVGSNVIASIVNISHLTKAFSDINSTLLAPSFAKVQHALQAYQAQVVTARAAIAATTGITKAMNMVIAASPYLIAAAAIIALGVAIYNMCTKTTEAEEAQKRLNSAYADMSKEATVEQLKLNALFEPLQKAKEGTEEWKVAKDKINEQYGDYLKQLGVEIVDVNSAKTAYDKLSESILNTARARAKEKMTSEAADKHAATEGEAIAEIREALQKKVGNSKGNITADEAEIAFTQIQRALQTGQSLPDEAQQILGKLNKTYKGLFGIPYSDETTSSIYKNISNIRTSLGEYKKEVTKAEAIFAETPINKVETETGTEGETNTNTNGERPTVVPIVPAKGSIAALEAELSKLRQKQENAPIQVAMEMQSQVKNLEERIAKEKMKIEHGEPTMIPLTLAPMKLTDTMQGALSGDMKANMQLTPIEISMDQPLTGMEQWNRAVEIARTNNEELMVSMGGMGSTMGSIGQAVGGAAGQWLQWGANCVQAIAAAIPQMMALMGIQRAKVAANTAEAGTGAAASVSSIPFVGPILAIAAVASVLAALAGIPKFAAGGLAYGPTLGLFGEYSGARNNPEVIAPLSKLRSMLDPSGGMGGKVEFRIKGRYLEGVLEKENKINRRVR